MMGSQVVDGDSGAGAACQYSVRDVSVHVCMGMKVTEGKLPDRP